MDKNIERERKGERVEEASERIQTSIWEEKAKKPNPQGLKACV